MRACKNPMHVAIALSLVIHAVFLSCILSPSHIHKRPNWAVVEVHLNTAALFQSDAGHTEAPVVNAPTVATAPKLNENSQERPVVQSGIDTQTSPSNYNPQMAGIAMPQELPLPSQGRRPLWSFQGSALVNAQAAYQAQMQHQAGTNVQTHARNARGQYEAYLKGALATLPLTGHCKIILSADTKPQVYCNSELDISPINAVIDRFGKIPAIHGDSSPLEIKITPTAEKHSNILS